MATIFKERSAAGRGSRSSGGQQVGFVTLLGRTTDYGCSKDIDILRRAIGLERTTLFSTRHRKLVDYFRKPDLKGTVLHLERLQREGIDAAGPNWFLPNQERVPERQIPLLCHVDLVLAKSRHAVEIFSDLGVPTFHLGFTSEDRRDSTIEKDWSRFLHLAGGNTLKGTEDILALWAAHPEWPELTLVQKRENAPEEVPANVRLITKYLTDQEIRSLQNHCGIHLCPSRAEGWGHYIVEALSTGAIVVTTDAPPMNELVNAECGMLVRWNRSAPRHLGTSYYVDRQALSNVIETLLEMPVDDKVTLGLAARRQFETIDTAFARRSAELFGSRSL